MSALVHAAVACRSRFRDCRPSDFVRAHRGGAVTNELTIAALANAYDSGFATCWPAGSRLLLDRFFTEWAARRAIAAVQERLASAFAAARQRFVDEAHLLLDRDQDFPDERPAAAFTAVVCQRRLAHVLWIGGDVAVLARAGKVAAVTVPHTLREQFRRERPELANHLDSVPDVLARLIGRNELDPDQPSLTTFELQPRDWILLLSRSSAKGTCISPAIAAAATTSPEATGGPAVVAEHLVASDFDEPHFLPYAAIAALHCAT